MNRFHKRGGSEPVRALPRLKAALDVRDEVATIHQFIPLQPPQGFKYVTTFEPRHCRTYVYWLRRYMATLPRYPATMTSEQKVERFLSDLVRYRDISASSQNQAFNAILFFYKDVLGQPLQGVDAFRAHRPAHIRHAPSIAETQALLGAIRNVGGYPTNLVARMLYGCGLRVSEPLNLRIKDVNLPQRRLCIRGAKGGKDRMVALPATLVPEIVQQVNVVQGRQRPIRPFLDRDRDRIDQGQVVFASPTRPLW